MSATVQPDLPEEEPVLPEAVRVRVTALAAAALTGLAADEVPTALRKVANFAPNVQLSNAAFRAKRIDVPRRMSVAVHVPQWCKSAH